LENKTNPGNTINDKRKSEECCPEFNPEKWDDKTFVWDKRKFIIDSMPTLFHIPFPPLISKKITRMWKSVEYSGSSSSDKTETLILFHDPFCRSVNQLISWLQGIRTVRWKILLPARR
jgi:hypothetical protein